MDNNYDEEIWEENKKRFEKSEIAPLFRSIRKGLIHCTGYKNIDLIINDGFIRPNDGTFPFSFGYSKNSYAYINHYTSLFDFETASYCECIDSCWGKWEPVLIREYPTVLIQLEKSRLPYELIPWKKAREDVGGKKKWIPYVETWHPGPIPISAAFRLLLILPPTKPSIQEFFDDSSIIRPLEYRCFDVTEEGLRSLNKALIEGWEGDLW